MERTKGLQRFVEHQLGTAKNGKMSPFFRSL